MSQTIPVYSTSYLFGLLFGLNNRKSNILQVKEVCSLFFSSNKKSRHKQFRAVKAAPQCLHAFCFFILSRKACLIVGTERLFYVFFQTGEKDEAKGNNMPKTMLCQQKVCPLISHWSALCHMSIREAEKCFSAGQIQVSFCKGEGENGYWIGK